MKDKILTLIIGILIGAIIATGCFLVLQKSNSHQMPQMNGGMGEPPSINGERPEKPDENGGNNLSQNNKNSTDNTEKSE